MTDTLATLRARTMQLRRRKRMGFVQHYGEDFETRARAYAVAARRNSGDYMRVRDLPRYKVVETQI